MAAPKGNQYAVGHGCGRKPEYTKEFIENEAREFIKFADREDALILREFAAIRRFRTQFIYEWALENQVFADAYEYARNIIGARREKLVLQKNPEAAWARYAKIHDTELHEFERGEKKYESDLKKEESTIPQELLEKYDEHMKLLDQLRVDTGKQKEKKALREKEKQEAQEKH